MYCQFNFDIYIITHILTLIDTTRRNFNVIISIIYNTIWFGSSAKYNGCYALLLNSVWNWRKFLPKRNLQNMGTNSYPLYRFATISVTSNMVQSQLKTIWKMVIKRRRMKKDPNMTCRMLAKELGVSKSSIYRGLFLYCFALADWETKPDARHCQYIIKIYITLYE